MSWSCSQGAPFYPPCAHRLSIFCLRQALAHFRHFPSNWINLTIETVKGTCRVLREPRVVCCFYFFFGNSQNTPRWSTFHSINHKHIIWFYFYLRTSFENVWIIKITLNSIIMQTVQYQSKYNNQDILWPEQFSTFPHNYFASAETICSLTSKNCIIFCLFSILLGRNILW